MVLKKKTLSIISTVIGLTVAIANAWITIDWSNFDIHKEWPKLVLSGVIALGGWITQIRQKDVQDQP